MNGIATKIPKEIGPLPQLGAGAAGRAGIGMAGSAICIHCVAEYGLGSFAWRRENKRKNSAAHVNGVKLRANNSDKKY